MMTLARHGVAGTDARFTTGNNLQRGDANVIDLATKAELHPTGIHAL
jgi:hypothetical protein